MSSVVPDLFGFHWMPRSSPSTARMRGMAPGAIETVLFSSRFLFRTPVPSLRPVRPFRSRCGNTIRFFHVACSRHPSPRCHFSHYYCIPCHHSMLACSSVQIDLCMVRYGNHTQQVQQQSFVVVWVHHLGTDVAGWKAKRLRILVCSSLW